MQEPTTATHPRQDLPLARQIDGLLGLETPEQVVEVIQAVENYVSRGRELKARLERHLLDWIEEHGEITHGTVRWYAGTSKSTKVRDVAAAMDALLDLSMGDIRAVAEVLSAQPFKHGAFRSLIDQKLEQVRAAIAEDEKAGKEIDPRAAAAVEFLENLFESLFRVDETPDLKTGKPKRGVQKVDTRFLPTKGATT